jgi:hypothetical protein
MSVFLQSREAKGVQTQASALLAQALGGDARVQREQRMLRRVVLTGAASSAEAAPLASSIIVWLGRCVHSLSVSLCNPHTFIISLISRGVSHTESY